MRFAKDQRMVSLKIRDQLSPLLPQRHILTVKKSNFSANFVPKIFRCKVVGTPINKLLFVSVCYLKILDCLLRLYRLVGFKNIKFTVISFSSTLNVSNTTYTISNIEYEYRIFRIYVAFNFFKFFSTLNYLLLFLTFYAYENLLFSNSDSSFLKIFLIKLSNQIC